jgi:ABC-type multidrug transport system fused ATPase/permease subunit
MAPIISIGTRRQLNDEDVWFLPFEFQHTRLHLLFREIKGSVVGRLVKANGVDLWITTGLGVLESFASLSEIVFLKQLLAALDGPDPKVHVAVVYACLTLFGRWIAAQSGVFTLWFSRRCYERSRGEMITMVYEKTLRRKAFTIPSGHVKEEQDNAAAEASSGISTTSATAVSSEIDDSHGEGDSEDDDDPVKQTTPPLSWYQKLSSPFRRGYQIIGSKPPQPPPPDSDLSDGPASTGKILNLMRNDVYEVAQRFWEFPSLVTKPLNFVLSIVLLWRFMGPSSLLGVVFLVAAQLINAYLVRVMLRVERSRRAVTDTKLQLTTQFVEAIRHLRWYDWQDAWLVQILASRQSELNKRVKVSILSRVVSTINSFASYMLPVAGFFGYAVLAGKPLTVDIAFPAIDLFTLLQTSLRELPDLITVLLNARVAVSRIEAFMAEPDKDMDNTSEEARPLVPAEDLRIEMRDASFSWPGKSEPVLQNISFTCRPGLTMVCGKVGIGKTALLQAILGELDQPDGNGMVTVPDETMAYASQSPWLQSMSIRENILFCARYDERRYRQVLDACCLLPDLAGFKAGDLSMIGENGVGLSGGQKARVALARALYSSARVLLFDDPISALDHQTAETILQKLFAPRSGSLMEGRMVVFVTHRVDIVTRYAYQVLDVVDGGKVITIGKDELESEEARKHLMEEAKTNAATSTQDDEPPAVDETTAIPDKFIEEEYRADGGVMASVYWRYVRAGGLRWWTTLILCFVLFRISRIAFVYFLKIWGEAYTHDSPSMLLHRAVTHYSYYISRGSGALQTMLSAEHTMPIASRVKSWFEVDLGLPNPNDDVIPWLWWFLVAAMAQLVTYALADIVIIVIIYNAGKRLFTEVMARVSNATFRFYDVTPVGRLMNRLTSDIGTMDGQIAAQLMTVVWSAIGWLSSVIVIGTATPLFLGLTVLMTAIFVYIFQQFLPASQSLRRLEMTSLSPLMSNFGTLLEGLITVRAFRAQPQFQDRLVATTDNFQKMDHFYWSLQAWLMYRFDTLSALATFTLTLTALFSGLSSGSVGFILAAAGNFVISTHQLCRKYGELQMQFVSVERVIELLDLDQEPSGSPDNVPPSDWPSHSDAIAFRNVTLRYAPHLDASLIDVSFEIPPGSTVAVTGRTGSGKSTLALALLGTILPDRGTGGNICIGGIDVATADKHALRRRVSFVAQDPVLFPGTLRDNLDPLKEHADKECEEVLRTIFAGVGGQNINEHEAQLQETRFTLSTSVDAGGKNLSQGQRQLIGLGRAVLRRSPIVILDEVRFLL